jgi:hypothetical protein
MILSLRDQRSARGRDRPDVPAGAPDAPRLALVGKAVTFDTGGYFLKPQSDIVRQKADMAGGAAVVAALGANAHYSPATRARRRGRDFSISAVSIRSSNGTHRLPP